MKILSGHTSKETAYLVEDYPYGFRLRCKIRYWMEHHPKHGSRMWSQTTNPKKLIVDHGINEKDITTIEYWNKPKASTYCFIAGAMYLDDLGHVAWSGLTIYDDDEKCDRWLNQVDVFDEGSDQCFREGIPEEVVKRVEAWIEEKKAYKAGGREAWLRLKIQRFKDANPKEEVKMIFD